MARAFILGATGQIGRSVGERLIAGGWDVAGASCGGAPVAPGVRAVAADRSVPGSLEAAIGDGADLLVDCIAFDASDAAQLVKLAGSVGRVCAISSAAVYCDAAGRNLIGASQTGFPDTPNPIPTTHMTVAPGDRTYATRKVAMEQTLLAGVPGRAAVLRPCAIHGPHSRSAREWWFIKRLLDGRRCIPLAYGGASRFQTTGVEHIADAVLAGLAPDAPSILNVADADAPSVGEIGLAIMATMEVEAELIGLSDQGYPPRAGVTPWSVPRPFVLKTSPAYPPRHRYAETVGATVADLIDRMRTRDWRAELPQLAAYPWDLFDYAADDKALAAA